MSDTPAGTPAPAGPTGPGPLPGALDGRAEQPDGTPETNQQQSTPAQPDPAPRADQYGVAPNGWARHGQPYAGQNGTLTYPVQNGTTTQHGAEQSPYAPIPHQANPYGVGPYPTPGYGQQPGQPPAGQVPPPGQAPPPDVPPTAALPSEPAPKPKRGRRVASMVAVAVLAAAVGGGVGGLVGHQTSTVGVSSLGTLNQPVPAGSGLPTSPVTQVAQEVLPSVVQLQGNSGEGSGVVLSADGLILTNAHVLAAAQGGQLTATFQNGSSAPVQEVGQDTQSDIAVVRAQGVSGLTPIQLGNSDTLQVGQPVVAVGTPLGLAGTVTSGIVSALNRPVETQGEPSPSQQQGQGGLSGLGGLGGLSGLSAAPQQQTPTSVLDAIQTDAAINPGNSGGPLVDMQGRIVGLNSAIASLGSGGGGQSGSIGLGFSIPINQAKRIADELIATGHATQAQLGVSVRDSQPNGAQLVSVAPGLAAAKAGLQAGDVVTKVGSQL
ncbi:MAG: putative serine protease PepD, partial [Pseudonocardiales bacterium]|nr:putative serine protease PepD [Pseudonocardiales bacterium]